MIKMCSSTFFFTRVSLHLAILSIISAVAAAQGGGARRLWCVAKNNAEESALQDALGWACGPGGADCGPIQNGGPCYDPSSLVRTASYAFNDYYYKKNPKSDDSCDFSNNAALIDLDPSHDSCKFPSSPDTSSISNGNAGGSGPGGPLDRANLSSTSSGGASFHGCGPFMVYVLFAILLML